MAIANVRGDLADAPSSRPATTAVVPTQPEVRRFESLDAVPNFFDPVSQEPLVLFAGDPEGDYELWKRGIVVSPQTGRELLPVTPEVLEGMHARLASDASSQADEEERLRVRAAADRQAQNDASFREQHVNAAAMAQLEATAPFVVLAIEGGTVESHLAQALQEQGVSVHRNVLRPAVFAPDIFSALSGADPHLLSRLGLGGLSGHILLGRLRLDETNPTGVGNTLNRKGYLTVSVVPLRGGTSSQLPPLSEVGAGFDAAQAQAAVEKRLVEALLKQGVVRRIVR